jgi:Fur family transcriptional regulator, ferric uptake regulator
MTLAPCAPAQPAIDVEEVLAHARARGLRASTARRLVLASLAVAGRPITAEAIARGAGGRVPRSDIGSVYRNLDALERTGIVRRLTPGDGAALYALAPPAGSGYLLCERCNEVCVADARALAAIRLAARTVLGYEVSFARVPLVGVCSGCANPGPSGGKRPPRLP